jgi:hypothetical protein
MFHFKLPSLGQQAGIVKVLFPGEILPGSEISADPNDPG